MPNPILGRMRPWISLCFAVYGALIVIQSLLGVLSSSSLAPVLRLLLHLLLLWWARAWWLALTARIQGQAVTAERLQALSGTLTRWLFGLALLYAVVAIFWVMPVIGTHGGTDPLGGTVRTGVVLGTSILLPSILLKWVSAWTDHLSPPPAERRTTSPVAWITAATTLQGVAVAVTLALILATLAGAEWSGLRPGTAGTWLIWWGLLLQDAALFLLLLLCTVLTRETTASPSPAFPEGLGG